MATSAESEALARLYDVDLLEDPGDLDLYRALADEDRRADPRTGRRHRKARRAARGRRLRGDRHGP